MARALLIALGSMSIGPLVVLGCSALLGNEERSLNDGDGGGGGGTAALPDVVSAREGSTVVPPAGDPDGSSAVEAGTDAGEVDADLPDVFDAGACPGSPACERTVFITSATRMGNLGGIAGADALCQSLADASTHPKVANHKFGAWLSTATSSVADRFVHGEAAYRSVGGTIIANGWKDLVDGSLLASIERDETDTITNGAVWTGINANGSTSADRCGEWTSTAGNGQQGLSPTTTGKWTDNSYHPCNESARLYCFER